MQGLVINCGSSSIKIKLIEVSESSTIFEARAEHLGSEAAKITVSTPESGKLQLRNHSGTSILKHDTALQEIIDYLAFISSLDDIRFVGHRVVHGGTFFSQPTLITDEVIEKIYSCVNLAELHNPASIIGIECIRKLLPNVPQVAVFDTAFHQTIPKSTYSFAIPKCFSEKGIRKYGFHGTSYAFLTHQLSELVGTNSVSAIMAHIGQGVSVCAVKDNHSVWTSMEFSPLSGCMMGSRCGTIDPTIISYLCNNYNYTVDEVINKLNKNSGLLAICGTNNMIEILKGVEQGREDCIEALDMFCSSIADNMSVAINHLGEDVKYIVFSGGIGENSPLVRQKVLDKMSPTLHYIVIDDNANQNNASLISCKHSPLGIYVIPTNEELEIAIESSKLI